jgi:Ulp1 family protease
LQAFATDSLVWCGQLPWIAAADAVALLAGIQSKAALFPDSLFHNTPFPLQLRLLASIADGQQLEGDVITAYMQALNARTSRLISRGDSVPSVYFLSTYFMTKLLENGGFNFTDARKQGGTSLRSMQACGSPFSSILDYSMVVVPCHILHPHSPQLNHWVLMVADLEQRTICTMDPLMVSCTRLLTYPSACILQQTTTMMCTMMISLSSFFR